MMLQFPDRPRFSVRARPLNCDPSAHDADANEKIRKRCPNCNQFHLRPGYCQALDPANAERYPHLHAKAVTDSAVTDNSVTDKICIICEQPFEAKRADAEICSAACRMRKRRAGGKK